ncbi:MAG TPA: hypothetical protein VFO07_05275, partial [Roseiflexaceae bacterium]|nr:hypothetical protein [Roseiflexaceae bacterium]
MTADQGVTGMYDGIETVGDAWWRQFGQSSGLRGMRSRWTRAVAHWAGEDEPCDHVQASHSRQSSSRSISQHQSGSISDL